MLTASLLQLQVTDYTKRFVENSSGLMNVDDTNEYNWSVATALSDGLVLSWHSELIAQVKQISELWTHPCGFTCSKFYVVSERNFLKVRKIQYKPESWKRLKTTALGRYLFKCRFQFWALFLPLAQPYMPTRVYFTSWGGTFYSFILAFGGVCFILEWKWTLRSNVDGSGLSNKECC